MNDTTKPERVCAETMELAARLAETQTERTNRDDESEEGRQYGAGYEQGCADAAAAIRAAAPQPPASPSPANEGEAVSLVTEFKEFASYLANEPANPDSEMRQVSVRMIKAVAASLTKG